MSTRIMGEFCPSSEINKLLQKINSFDKVEAAKQSEHPIHGTTIYVASCKIQTRYGEFNAHVFQELITKGYIIALAHGDIKNAKKLYTRIHSSCVTSETLRGCDCDCVKQLEGALRRIADKKAGIFFYLIQEGRGVGYIGKARDRMIVQASQDKISTFEAYRALGLKKDYRNYESIASICNLLGINAPFVLLTNNPDKVAALKNLGISIEGTEKIEFEPGPYNLAYLTSKAESGHSLERPGKFKLQSALAPEPIEPFSPYAIKEAQRFIYSAKYYLPMKPVDGLVLITKAEYEKFIKPRLREFQVKKQALIENISEQAEGRVFMQINRKVFSQYRHEHPQDPALPLFTNPYWFAVNVYYDLVSGQEFVVLVHGSNKFNSNPIVRLHSESIFDRFPLEDLTNRNKLKASSKLIVQNGYGIIVLLYNDGRGAGLGAHAIDRSLREDKVSKSSSDTYKMLGIEYDLRDYEAAMRLIAHHVQDQAIKMVLTSPNDLVRKLEYTRALANSKIKVRDWIFLEDLIAK